jgi:glycerol dehydrogenase-like iron-containing ADH family enzyme
MQEWAIAPGRTMIEAKAVHSIGPVARKLGTKAIVFGGTRALDLTATPIQDSLRTSKVDCIDVVPFFGECCPAAIRPIEARLAPGYVAIAVGGGKVIDTVKAAARAAGAALITVPTSPATCAAVTALCVLHTAAGAYDVGKVFPPAPDATILDLDILATSPRRLIAAGLADAWARSLETDLSAHVALPTGGSVFSHGLAMAYAERILLEEGKLALEKGREAGELSFERVMSAAILGAGVASGLCRGFFLLNVAHSVSYGLTHLMDPETALHGESVAVGLMVQAFLADGTGKRLQETERVLQSWTLPVRFDQLLGTAPGSVFLDRLAKLVLRNLDHEHAVPFAVTENSLRNALESVSKA